MAQPARHRERCLPAIQSSASLQSTWDSTHRWMTEGAQVSPGAVAGVVGIEVGVVSGVFNLESSGVDALDWRPRHEEH
jgi:hypothetical protein